MTEKPELVSYLNGRVVPLSQAVAELRGGGFESAGGFYDHERTFGGRLFKLREHLSRLYNGVTHSGIDPGLGIDELQAITEELVETNRARLSPGHEFLVTQIVSEAPQPHEGPPGANVVVYCQFLDVASFAADYVNGVRIVTPTTYPMPARQPGPLQPRVFPLMVDSEGSITECRGGNFMLVKDGRIKLPNRLNVLPGVSMATVLEIADSLGIEVDEDDYSTWDAYTADEAFVSSTRFCMVPVVDVNGLRIGEDVPGPVTRTILDRWVELVEVDFVQQALGRLRTGPSTPPEN